MKRTPLMLVLVIAATVPGNAAVVFSDDFSHANGTAIAGQTPDTGSGTWTGGGGWQVNGGALALVGGSDSVYGAFTDALSAGETLTITFTTGSITGFIGTSWAVVSLFDNSNSELAYIGDPGGPTTYWSMGGSIANVTTADSSQANTATFSYAFDTGAWSFSTAGGSYNGTGPTGRAIDHIRIASAGTSDSPAGNMKLESIAVTIVPEPGSALLALAGTLALCRRRRAYV
ncbi:MAG: hypothetical protein J0M04_08355 [Verrucomicrobia bacterium]|nr:hypothetical protein [Verrucomicrobiota bacterium]